VPANKSPANNRPKDQEHTPAAVPTTSAGAADAQPSAAAAATPQKPAKISSEQRQQAGGEGECDGAGALAAMTPVAAAGARCGSLRLQQPDALNADRGGSLSPPYAVVVVGKPFAAVAAATDWTASTGKPPARPPQQLELRDAIFAGVMEPADGSSASAQLPPPSVTPRGCDEPNLGLLSPHTLDPLALLRMSMVNPEFPSPSPPTGFDTKTSPFPTSGMGTGILSPPAGSAAGASGGGRSGGAAGGGDDGGMIWSRRRRVSAVLREELAEVAKALEAGLPQVGFLG